MACSTSPASKNSCCLVCYLHPSANLYQQLRDKRNIPFVITAEYSPKLSLMTRAAMTLRAGTETDSWLEALSNNTWKTDPGKGWRSRETLYFI